MKTSFDKVFGQSVYNTVAGMNKYFLRMVQFTKVCQQKSVLTPFSVDDTLFGSSKISVGVGGSRIPDHNRENSPICEILFSL